MNQNPGNAQKTPFTRAINDFAAEKIASSLQLTGKRLPVEVVAVQNWTVTVKFLVNATPFTLPQLTVPVEESQYFRHPIQIGDQGWVQAADTYVGNVTGLGGTNPPDLTKPGNLSALIFCPLSSTNWPDVSDLNSALVQGPNGVSMWDMGKNTTAILTPSGYAVVGKNTITLTVGSNSITVNSSGITIDGDVNVTGKVTATGEGTFNGGHTVSAHVHGGVTAGASNTSTPTG